jgi:hypothetical protein
MLDRVISDRRAWLPESIENASWALTLGPYEIEEIRHLVLSIRAAPIPPLLRATTHFQVGRCKRFFKKITQALLFGPGFVVLAGLAEIDMNIDELKVIFWVMGQYLSSPVATKWDGTMIYDVVDTGKSFGPGVRGSATNVELSIHNDNAFGISVPDYVGLLCLQPAVRGGISRVFSLYSVHNNMLCHCPNLLQRLYQPVYFDRQAEHASGEPSVLQAPILEFTGTDLKLRLAPNLVRRGYEAVGERIDQHLVDALAYIEEIAGGDNYSIEFSLKPRDVQYIHNHTCGHARSAFVDGDTKRHLLRIWYRENGLPTYDG